MQTSKCLSYVANLLVYRDTLERRSCGTKIIGAKGRELFSDSWQLCSPLLSNFLLLLLNPRILVPRLLLLPLHSHYRRFYRFLFLFSSPLLLFLSSFFFSSPSNAAVDPILMLGHCQSWQGRARKSGAHSLSPPTRGSELRCSSR
jgi:hypothetical protein